MIIVIQTPPRLAGWVNKKRAKLTGACSVDATCSNRCGGRGTAGGRAPDWSRRSGGVLKCYATSASFLFSTLIPGIVHIKSSNIKPELLLVVRVFVWTELRDRRVSAIISVSVRLKRLFVPQFTRTISPSSTEPWSKAFWAEWSLRTRVAALLDPFIGVQTLAFTEVQPLLANRHVSFSCWFQLKICKTGRGSAFFLR